jgi:enhancing lycopene biosynthesis protein 2
MVEIRIPKIAVILCGCGSMDGSEIHEATFTLLSIDELGAEYKCFALDKPQGRVMDFVTGTEEPTEKRNQLKESARISRGKIQNIVDLKVNDFDALILPGGYGAAFNLCDFAKLGENASVDPEIKRVLTQFHEAQKPIGAICISPAIVALVLGKLRKLDCEVIASQTNDCVIDIKNKIVTTPAYMNAKRISEVRQGIAKLTAAVLELVT